MKAKHVQTSILPHVHPRTERALGVTECKRSSYTPHRSPSLSPMATVHLLSAAAHSASPWAYAFDDLHRMRRSAAADRFGVHALTDDPAAADVILFVENCDPIRHYFEVRRHPVYRALADRCFLFSRHDHPVPFLPGVYASIPRRWHDPARTRGGLYLNAFDHPFIEYSSAPVARDYLYSFIGQVGTHPLREAMMGLPDDEGFLFDTTPYWPYAELDDETRRALERQYVDVATRSAFVLCPRGRGASSIRLFEMMRMGRAPVIVSDEWTPPEGPDWDTFSVRVAEGDLDSLPEILRTRADDAAAMGERARRCWENWFSEEATFHRVTNWCLDLRAEHAPRWAAPWSHVGPQLLRPLYLRTFVRGAYTRLTEHATGRRLSP